MDDQTIQDFLSAPPFSPGLALWHALILSTLLTIAVLPVYYYAKHMEQPLPKWFRLEYYQAYWMAMLAAGVLCECYEELPIAGQIALLAACFFGSDILLKLSALSIFRWVALVRERMREIRAEKRIPIPPGERDFRQEAVPFHWWNLGLFALIVSLWQFGADVFHGVPQQALFPMAVLSAVVYALAGYILFPREKRRAS